MTAQTLPTCSALVVRTWTGHASCAASTPIGACSSATWCSLVLSIPANGHRFQTGSCKGCYPVCRMSCVALPLQVGSVRGHCCPGHSTSSISCIGGISMHDSLPAAVWPRKRSTIGRRRLAKNREFPYLLNARPRLWRASSYSDSHLAIQQRSQDAPEDRHCGCQQQNDPQRGKEKEEKHITGAVAFVLIIVARHLSRSGRQRLTGLPNQLFTGFIAIDLGALRIIGLGIQIQHVFHGGDKLPTHLGQTPLLVLPGLECVFLSTWRTVSRAIDSANPNSTTWSASTCKVQRVWLRGAGGQATAMSWASCVPLSLRWPPGRGSSWSASKLTSTKRWRVRSTVAMLTSRAIAISSSVSPSSAWSKMRARVSLRALLLPRCKSCSSVVRSSAVRSTTYFFFGIVTVAPGQHWLLTLPQASLPLKTTRTDY